MELELATDIVTRFEGFRSAPYQDSVGVWTIGYGRTYLPDGSRVTASTPPVTEPEAREVLSWALQHSVPYIHYLAIPAVLADHEAAALASFAYNLGVSALRGSKLLRKLRTGDRVGAAAEFAGWCHAGGRVSPGLVRRRAAERAMFLGEKWN